MYPQHLKISFNNLPQVHQNFPQSHVLLIKSTIKQQWTEQQKTQKAWSWVISCIINTEIQYVLTDTSLQFSFYRLSLVRIICAICRDLGVRTITTKSTRRNKRSGFLHTSCMQPSLTARPRWPRVDIRLSTFLLFYCCGVPPFFLFNGNTH